MPTGKVTSPQAQLKKLGNILVDFYVDGGSLKSKPSTLIAIKNGKVIIKREGVIKVKV